MTITLRIDFGSTYTKLRAIDTDRRCMLGSGQGPSTVTTDITIGMKAALADTTLACPIVYTGNRAAAGGS